MKISITTIRHTFLRLQARLGANSSARQYAAGEAPIVAADGRSLARALRVAGKVEPLFVDDITNLPQTIASSVRGGDVVICMGAGSIGAVPGKVLDMLSKSELIALEGRAL